MKARYFLAVAFVGCTFGPSVDTCPGVCWSYTQMIEDSEPDGDFDSTCKDSGGFDLEVAIPMSGDMTGQTCVTNPVHLAMRSVIRSVNHNGDTSEATMQEISDYITATNAISEALRIECRAWLLGEGCVVSCQDPENCTQQEATAVEAADAICDDFLVTPSQDAMHDFTGCTGWDPPVESTIGNIEVSDPDECFALDTGGGDDLGDPPIMCDGDGEAGAPADETGEELGFGDLDNLISCSPSTTCEIGDELLYNVQANFEIFHDEGVLLTMVSLSGGTSGGTIVGAQLTGLDSGEDSYDLLWTHLGLRNNDVITHVNTVPLNSSANVLEVLEDLLTTATWDVTVRRARSGGWDTREYFIHLPFTSP